MYFNNSAILCIVELYGIYFEDDGPNNHVTVFLAISWLCFVPDF